MSPWVVTASPLKGGSASAASALRASYHSAKSRPCFS